MSQTYRKLSVVLSLLLLAPGAALAESADAGPAARTELSSSLHLLEPTPEPEGANPLLRRLAVTGGATLAGTLSGLSGLYLTYMRVHDFNHAAMGWSLATSAALGAPLGAVVAGSYAGGRGTYLGSLAGAAVGAGAGMAIAVATIDTPAQGLMLAFPVLTVVGTVIGYELSHASNTPPPADAAPSLQPMVAVTPTSAALGLGGTWP